MMLLAQPYLLTRNPSSEMNIVWVLSEPTDGFVEFGSTKGLGKRIEAKRYEISGFRQPLDDGTYGEDPDAHTTVSVWQYIVTISNLSPAEVVYYRCCYGSDCTKIFDFHTAPTEGTDFRFAQISDLQALPNCHETVYNIGCFHPDFILFSGDATYTTWRLDQWFDLHGNSQDQEARKKAFFPCMQQENGAKLMQYAPLFFCPGNHEPNHMKCGRGIPIEDSKSHWNWSIFMQLFRPLYPDPDTGINGVRWYSVNYADLHIVSLSINRLGHINDHGKIAYLLADSIEPDSRQLQWLKNDLEIDRSKFKWVITHFHILSKAWDAKFNLCSPVIDDEGNATYPNDRGSMLIDIFSEHKVNAVSYGHSHVYERYFTKGTHYIEAAYLSITYAGKEDLPHPSGNLPVVEDNSRRSFVILERKKEGLFATGYYAADEPIAFDMYQIADKDGNSVPPPELSDYP